MSNKPPARTKRGTFSKGSSGNPSGRPRKEFTIIKEEFGEKAKEVAKVVIEAALSGDLTAAKFILDRLSPPLKAIAAPVVFELPEGLSPSEICRKLIEHTAKGDLSPDTATQLISATANLTKIIEVEDLQKRIEVLERITAKRKS